MNWWLLVLEAIVLVLVFIAFGQYMCWWKISFLSSIVSCNTYLTGSWTSSDDGDVVIRADGTGAWTKDSIKMPFHYDEKTGNMQMDGTKLIFTMWTKNSGQTLYINPSDANPGTSVFTTKKEFARLITS